MAEVSYDYHVPIMKGEVIKFLITSPDGVYVDGTLGGGGHSRSILENISSNGKLIAIDRDIEAIKHSDILSKEYNNFVPIHGNFHNISNILNKLNINKIDGCLLDLGVSSYQLDNGYRGFSVHQDNYLDMRMDTSSGITAAEYLQNVTKEEFERILYDYSDENWAKRIAEELIEYRSKQPVKTTYDLVQIVDNAIPKKVRMKIQGHPARKTFQAVRIAINDEIDPLYDCLIDIIELLKPNARICVLTFHSIEDRIVKNCLKKCENPCTCDPKLPICVCGKKPLGKILTRKPIIANDDEQTNNIRSRSAKLRIFEKY